MGVKSVLRWVVPKGSQPSHQDAGRIRIGFETLLGKPDDNNWEVKVQFMRQYNQQGVDRSKQAGMKDIWLITFSDAPETCFMLLRSEKQVVEASPSIVQLLERKLDYRTVLSLKLEGQKWRVGDFSVKLGAVTQTGTNGSPFLGHVVEVDYLPVQHRDVAEPIMKELISHLLAAVPKSPTGWLEECRNPLSEYVHLPATFGPMHSAVLYMELALASATAAR